MNAGIKVVIGIGFLTASLVSSQAITTVAGINFQDNAFADSVIASSGAYTLVGAATLSGAVDGSSLTHYAFSFSPGAYIQIGFLDNYLVNGAGNDLALFDYGAPNSFGVALTIGGVVQNYSSVATGASALIGNKNYSINVTLINLDDFGIAAGAQLGSVVIDMDTLSNTGTVPALGIVGALNSISASDISRVPDANSTISLLGMALLGLGALKRKQ